MIGLFNKTVFGKDQALLNVYSKGKNFYAHYPVFPPYNYVIQASAEEPKFVLMER